MLKSSELRQNSTPIDRLEGRMKHNLLSSTSMSTGFKPVMWAHPTLEDIKDFVDMLNYKKYLAENYERKRDE